jgi:hypothetical protein
MTASSPQASGHFQSLSEERCRELLASRRQGRIAWNSPTGPELLPVSYGLHAGQVAFRTAPYGVLSQLRHPTMVAFEIDDINPEAGTGWSVLVRGRAEAVTRSQDLSMLWGGEVGVPWAPGTRNLYILIHERSISGRTVKAPFAD